jgi:hypothetical protein
MAAPAAPRRGGPAGFGYTPPAMAPLVSVVIATYNRSATLRLTVESVRWQSISDWEVIVAGDACTDDTPAVMASFDDPRIRFVNLTPHCGEQSGPNNHGYALSGGRYLAFLNHDDIWFPDHLERALAFIEETGADLVYPLPINLDRHGRFGCYAVNEELRYDPSFRLPASFWLLRRSLVDEIGPWRMATETFATMPSQEFLTRAWRAGKTLRGFAAVTVITVPASGRPLSYVTREASDQQRLVEQIRSDPRFRERVLTGMVHASAMPQPMVTVRAAVGRWLAAGGARVATAMGLNPLTIAHTIRYRRRGGHVDVSRRVRGLPPLTRRKAR